jgi:hypothetical protein
MNIYQCEAKAQQIGYDKSTFIAVFPVGPVQCKWLDAYMGILKIDIEGLRDGFLTTSQLDRVFPDLICSEPRVCADEI